MNTHFTALAFLLGLHMYNGGRELLFGRIDEHSRGVVRDGLETPVNARHKAWSVTHKPRHSGMRRDHKLSNCLHTFDRGTL